MAMQHKVTRRTATSARTTTTELLNVEAEFVSVARAEALTGISQWTWRQYAYRGKIASSKLGTRLLIPVKEIRRVLAAGYRPCVDVREHKVRA
jgi:hypothetical protein